MTGLHDLVHRYPTMSAKAPISCALTWTKSKACWFAHLEQSRMVCFNQEESVAGLISEVCPFLKEMKSRD